MRAVRAELGKLLLLLLSLLGLALMRGWTTPPTAAAAAATPSPATEFLDWARRTRDAGGTAGFTQPPATITIPREIFFFLPTRHGLVYASSDNSLLVLHARVRFSRFVHVPPAGTTLAELENGPRPLDPPSPPAGPTARPPARRPRARASGPPPPTLPSGRRWRRWRQRRGSPL